MGRALIAYLSNIVFDHISFFEKGILCKDAYSTERRFVYFFREMRRKHFPQKNNILFYASFVVASSNMGNLCL